MPTRKDSGRNAERKLPGLLDPPTRALVPNHRDAADFPSKIGTVPGVQHVGDYGAPQGEYMYDWRNATRTTSPSRARHVAPEPK